YTAKENAPAQLTSATESEAVQNSDDDWKRSLEEIQLQSGISLPEPPSEESVAAFLAAAQEGNVTESVSRTLFITLSNAAAQGLGSDIPTQDKLIAGAQAQLGQGATQAYTTADLELVPNTKENMHAYGNGLAAAVNAHPQASAAQVLYSMGFAVDNNSVLELQKLEPISREYRALVDELLLLSTPETLSPIHVQILNDLSRAAESIKNMQALPQDPLLSLTGLQVFQSSTAEVLRLFINLARQFSENAILFTTDEPGSAWEVLLSPSL
ncbi:MAG TPA: hypothetical protein VJZ94_00380, partial [Candidatus Paceibacterota bacterium]|nr:hypothetical protein [Candidatus Paceibacterota bacterium]